MIDEHTKKILLQDIAEKAHYFGRYEVQKHIADEIFDTKPLDKIEVFAFAYSGNRMPASNEELWKQYAETNNLEITYNIMNGNYIFTPKRIYQSC